MKFICFLLSLITVSCSFSGKGNDEHESVSAQPITALDLKKMDSDGDLISDYEESQRGLDSYVADIPKVIVNFLQDYKIKVHYQDESSFEIDTRVAKDDPDFKYRVGELFLKENSLSNAAKLGRFSGISWGKIKQEDLSWVQYPQIDEKYHFDKRREYGSHKNKKVKELQVELENNLRLAETAIFKSIEGLELNFYYYSHSKESYLLLHTEKIESSFQAGVRDNFVITINNPPLELLEDNYFRHGEFIISEVKDFYIPEYGIRYRELLSSVRAKSLPVYKSTPFDSGIQYVAVGEDGETFINILSKLYSEKFEVKGNELVQVEQFRNNLPGFKHLHELVDEDKAGRWFVMTNELKQHYLKHKFSVGDTITLSYVTGEELARREADIVPSFRRNTFSEDKEKVLPLGNISNNSKLSVSLYFNSLKGIELVSTPGQFAYSPPSCRNCTGNNWSVWANFSHNTFRNFERAWSPKEYKEVSGVFDLFINNTKLDLEDLLKKNIAHISFEEGKNGVYLHIEIHDIHKLNLIKSGSENLAFLKVRPFNVSFDGEGVQLNEIGGSNIDKNYHAGLICLQQAARLKAPLAVTSYAFEEWKGRVRWGIRDRKGFTPTKGQKKKHYSGVVVDVISKITNFYN